MGATAGRCRTVHSSFITAAVHAPCSSAGTTSPCRRTHLCSTSSTSALRRRACSNTIGWRGTPSGDSLPRKTMTWPDASCGWVLTAWRVVHVHVQRACNPACSAAQPRCRREQLAAAAAAARRREVHLLRHIARPGAVAGPIHLVKPARRLVEVVQRLLEAGARAVEVQHGGQVGLRVAVAESQAVAAASRERSLAVAAPQGWCAAAAHERV